MPLMKVDFTALDNSNAIAKQLEHLMSFISRPMQFTSRCLLLGSRLQPSKNKCQRLKDRVQLSWTIFLCVVICVAIAVSLCTMPLVYNSIYLAGCIDFFFLVYWCRSSKEPEFLKRLRKSSTGVGTLKKSKQMMQRKNVAVAICSVCSLVAFVLILADVVGVIHLLPKTSISVPRTCFYLSSLFISLLTTPAAHSTVFCYTGSVGAEFEVIDKDFATDGNKHQLPVARHYIRGHGQLLRVFDAIRGAVSAWCSAHIVLNFIAIYNILCLLYAFEYDLASVAQLFRPAMLCFVLVAMVLQTICIFHMALTLRKWMVGMRAPMMRVAAGDHLPHEQVFSLFSLHLLDLQHQPPGVSFFGLTLIDRHFLNTCLVLSVVAAVYRYGQYNW